MQIKDKPLKAQLPKLYFPYCWPTMSLYLDVFLLHLRGHGNAVIIHSPPTSEVSGSNPGPYVEKLVVL